MKASPLLAADGPGAASALGLVESDRRTVRSVDGSAVGGFADFADLVHDRLCAVQPGDVNAVVLDAYAWVAAESDRSGGLGWIYEAGRDEFADRANAALVGEDDDGRLMNTTKVPAWRRWLRFMGLGQAMPDMLDYPSPASRLAIELRRSGSGGSTMDSNSFLQVVATRCPYLDRGRLFNQACRRIGHTPSTGRLSPLLSGALRDLHDEGALTLQLAGDSAGAVLLSAEPTHSMGSFTSVMIPSEIVS
ncbi:hypothetical protein [Sphingomonas faeni]|uniref:hypothetical protein n=1 Tax=Sphingomonas faeni TaxID=185950 RepID=UPI00334CB6E1